MKDLSRPVYNKSKTYGSRCKIIKKFLRLFSYTNLIKRTWYYLPINIKSNSDDFQLIRSFSNQ